MSILVKWCGIGLDLAADYNAYGMRRISTTLLNLLKKLTPVDNKYGDISAEYHTHSMQSYQRIHDLINHPEKFDPSSPEYMDRIVAVPGDREFFKQILASMDDETRNKFKKKGTVK